MHTDKLKKFDLALIAGLLAAILITPLAGFGQDCAAVRGEVLRLHILANSDSAEDQALKLQVRDAVLAECGSLFGSAQTSEEAESLTAEHLVRLEEIARRTVGEAGRSDPVRAELVHMYFETRTYGDVTLPAGYYDALRITIGDAAGKNWWCVMFPPLCLPTADADAGQNEREDIRALGKETPHYRLAFRSVELIEELLDKVGAHAPEAVSESAVP